MGVRYHELVVQGPRGRARGFIEGVLSERGHRGALREASEEGLDCAPLRERLGEILRPSAETLHLLVPELLLPAVREALAHARETGIEAELVGERPVHGARFRFQLQVYSPEHAERIRAFFDPLPEGVRLSADSTFEEIRDPGASGIETYAPAHEYELRAKGVVEGDLDGVLSIFHRCREEDLVRESSAELIA